ncbi:MAG: ATP-binding protein [Candidatus Omnitrophica bacterium]|nr:ATP-binding protein [Candidatus Omnitrophota bacterium]
MEHSLSGRKEILSLLKKRVTDLKEGYRQNVALIGSLYVGKTTILHQLLAELDEGALIPVYLDLENRDLDYLASKTARSILYHFCKNKGLAVSEDLSQLINTARPHIPRTVEWVEGIAALIGGGRLEELLDRVLALPNLFSQETDRCTVIVYDEFQALAEFGVPGIFRKLADCITTQKRSLCVIASSYEEQSKKILAEELTLLFGNFEIVHVLPLDLRASQEFIERRMGGLRMGLQLRNFLADFTGGRPLYLDILIQEVINLGAIFKQQEVYAPLVVQAMENLIFNRWGALNRHFELALNRITVGKNSQLVTDILFAMANGARKVKDIIDQSGGKPAHVAQRIKYLIDEDIVEKNGNYFHIKDKLMRYWIKYVFQKRVKSIEMEPGRQRKEFKEEINRAVTEFQTKCRMDLPSRMMELLNCFDNEQFDLYGRTYKLPVFRGLTPIKMHYRGGTSFDVIKADTDDGLWLLILRKDPLAENDINAVTDEARKMGLRPRKCVIVSLASLDDGARLRALEERMWIWNEPVLNSLMSLYDKPYIVL